jgi:ribosomal protein S18 acetylase RimI-like enzyme
VPDGTIGIDGVAMVESDHTIGITGAYVQPAYRGRKAAVALLDAALRDYAQRGFTCCTVNFESFNPEAAAFWMKYFELVGLSLMRVPENVRAVTKSIDKSNVSWRYRLKPPSPAASLPRSRAEDGAASDFVRAVQRMYRNLDTR